MDKTTVIKLIKEHITYDEIKQKVVERTSREVYAQMRGIVRAEWFEAGRNGLKPEITFVMNAFDYEGEKIIEHNGSVYGVYRTYIGRNDSIELYCEKKGGLNGEDEKSPCDGVQGCSC